MTTGYIAPAGDLDALFMPRTSTAIANVGFLSNGGVDLAQRFEPRGAITAIANTGFKSGANDLATLFRDIASGAVSISNLSAANSDAGTVTALYRLTSGGDIFANNGTSSVIDRGDWISPKVNMSLYSARVTPQSGTSPGGAGNNVWLNLGTNREWSISGVSLNFSGFLVEIRLDSTGIVQSSATISLQVH